jgi:hypothetical protein
MPLASFYQIGTELSGRILIDAAENRGGSWGGLEPTGPSKARPDDRLRRNPPFTNDEEVDYGFASNPTVFPDPFMRWLGASHASPPRRFRGF